MTPFFIPGVAPSDDGEAEREYARFRRQTEHDMGRRPSSRRIFSLWTRRGAVDCVTEVGRGDPLRGGTVLAIFDMGLRQPFVVWWQQDGGSGNEIPEILGSTAYSVREFDGEFDRDLEGA